MGLPLSIITESSESAATVPSPCGVSEEDQVPALLAAEA